MEGVEKYLPPRSKGSSSLSPSDASIMTRTRAACPGDSGSLTSRPCRCEICDRARVPRTNQGTRCGTLREAYSRQPETIMLSSESWWKGAAGGSGFQVPGSEPKPVWVGSKLVLSYEVGSILVLSYEVGSKLVLSYEVGSILVLFWVGSRLVLSYGSG